jgi:hypothetical protein
MPLRVEEGEQATRRLYDQGCVLVACQHGSAGDGVRVIKMLEGRRLTVPGEESGVQLRT